MLQSLGRNMFGSQSSTDLQHRLNGRVISWLRSRESSSCKLCSDSTLEETD